MSQDPSSGWRNDTSYPVNWPMWLSQRQTSGEVVVDRVFTAWSGHVLVRRKNTHRWVFYNDTGVTQAESPPIHEDLLPLAWLKANAPMLYPPDAQTETPPMATRRGQTEIANDGSWAVDQQVEVEVAASGPEIMTAAESQADLSLKVQSLRESKTKMNHDFTRKIKAAEGEQKAAAMIVHTKKRVEMKEAKVHFDPVAKVKTAKAKNGAIYWEKPMTPEELELGNPNDEGPATGEGDEGTTAPD